MDQPEVSRVRETLVGTVMSTDVLCVPADTSAVRVEALLTGSHYRCAVVVDADQRPVGIVSKSDLLRVPIGGLGSPRSASDLMSARVHALPREAPLSYAVALMASERLLEVPVVDEHDVVIGIITALDALAWVARHSGYVFDRAS